MFRFQCFEFLSSSGEKLIPARRKGFMVKFVMILVFLGEILEGFILESSTIEALPNQVAMDGFEINEKVFVYQGPVLYEAKIIKSFDPLTQKVCQYDEKKKEYVNVKPDKKFPNKHLTEKVFMVHYQGWNAKWDEWVVPSRVLKYNNENLMLMQNLQLEIQQQERLKSEQEIREKFAKEQEKAKSKSSKSNSKSKKDSKNNQGDVTKTISSLKKIKLKLNGDSISSIIVDEKNGSNTGKVTKSKGTLNGHSKSKHKHENLEKEISHRKGKKSINSLIGNGIENGNVIDTDTTNNLYYKQKYSKEPTSSSSSSSSSFSTSSSSTSSSSFSSSATTAPTTHYESHTGFTQNEIKSLIPDELKIILVNDWENITRNNKLVIIPSKITVSKTIEDFKDYLELEFNDADNELTILLELTESIKQYFNQCIGTFLLYRYERIQFNELLESGEDEEGKRKIHEFYDIYHPIFLLRLLSIFPNILTINEVDSSTIRLSKAYLDILLHWLNINKEKYLININYENQNPWVSIMNGG